MGGAHRERDSVRICIVNGLELEFSTVFGTYYLGHVVVRWNLKPVSNDFSDLWLLRLARHALLVIKHHLEQDLNIWFVNRYLFQLASGKMVTTRFQHGRE